MKIHGPWKIKTSMDVYRDGFIHVWKDEVVRPDGNDGQHVVVSMKPGICVLAIDDDLTLHLTEEFHYGVGRVSIECVSGGIESGEEPDDTAKRELREELGLIAEQWEYLSTTDPFTTIMVSPTRLYFARQLKRSTAAPEGTEMIRPFLVSLPTATEMVLNGQITHGPTCILILRAAYQFGVDDR